MRLSSHSKIARRNWARLRGDMNLPFCGKGLSTLEGVSTPVTVGEAEEIYLPLACLINAHSYPTLSQARVMDRFAGRPPGRRPYVIAIAGSVAAGKSTAARLLQALLRLWPEHARVQLVSTDSFLRRARYLRSRQLMHRKGFPETYDIGRMVRFLTDVRLTGCGRVPVYSHEAYDIVPGAFETIESPDVLIIEGLNVLRIGDGLPPRLSPVFTASDFFDLSVFIDAAAQDIERWYVQRFLALRESAFRNQASPFHHLAHEPPDAARALAYRLWQEINLPNLHENILPTRSRADVILRKRADHMVGKVLLRRL